MRCLVYVLVLSGLFSCGAIGAEAPPRDLHAEPMPEVLWGPEPQTSPHFPLFVGTERILLPDGTVDPSLFSDSAIATIRQKYLDPDPVEPCAEGEIPGGISNAGEPHWAGFSSILEEADVVVLALVTGVMAGIGHDSPGTLARLKPLQWLKGSDDWQVKYRYFTNVQLELNGRVYCLRHPDYPETPARGDRVLIAYNKNWHSRVMPWILTSSPSILVLGADGRSSLSGWARRAHPEWIGRPSETVLGEIKALLSKSAASEGKP